MIRIGDVVTFKLDHELKMVVNNIFVNDSDIYIAQCVFISNEMSGTSIVNKIFDSVKLAVDCLILQDRSIYNK